MNTTMVGNKFPGAAGVQEMQTIINNQDQKRSFGFLAFWRLLPPWQDVLVCMEGVPSRSNKVEY